MNEFVKIRADIDEATQKKILKLLKKYKSNQDNLIKEVAAVVLENTDDSGTVILSPSLTLKIKDSVSENLNNVYQDEKAFLDEILGQAYIEATEMTAKTIGIKVDWGILREEFVKRAINAPIDGKTYSNRIWKNTNDLANRIYNEILECIRTGKRPNQIWQQIKKDYGTTAYQAKRLVNTELAKVVNDAQLSVYRNSGIVSKVMWTATLEKNTCKLCAELDGKQYDLDKVPTLPLHPCCRCCLIPIVDDYKPNTRTDNETHENIVYVTFTNWH